MTKKKFYAKRKKKHQGGETFAFFSDSNFFFFYMFLWRLPAIRCYTTSIRPQTIYALSSSPGKAGVAVIRISGQHAKEVKEKYR